MMKRISCLLCAAICLIGCGTTEKQLNERAAELCKHIPDLHQLEKSRDFLTKDFYAVLDTMVNLPDATPLEHQWEWWFVADDGTYIPYCDCKVLAVEQSDTDHALATILVQPQDTFDYVSDEHLMSLERVHGKWLMADFDGHKAHAVRYIETARHEQGVRQAISDYLVNNIAPYYLQGEVCVPTIQLVAANDTCVYGIFYVFWYNLSGDTLKTVSSGMHAGRMSLTSDNGKTAVTSFEQTVDGAGNWESAKRIFGDLFDVYVNITDYAISYELARHYQLREYVHAHDMRVHYYQDYGWEPSDLTEDLK